MSDNMRIKIIDEVRYCCKEMKEHYESHDDIRFDTKDGVPIFFYKMVYKGKMIDECPFCGAHIEVQISKSHWKGY